MTTPSVRRLTIPRDPISGNRIKALRTQCQATITEASLTQWRKDHGKTLQCERDALFEVAGEKLCSLHAGRKCLMLMLGEES